MSFMKYRKMRKKIKNLSAVNEKVGVSLSDGSINLEKTLSLKSHQLSQLSFWGFLKVTNGYSAIVDKEPATLLFKIVKFFEKENIPFSLSQECEEIIEMSEKSRIDFEGIKSSAQKFKDGVYDRKKFSDFKNSLENALARPLKEHQLKAAYHLYLVGNGANFSVPGSGKTSVVLSIYEKLRMEGRVNTLFVVGPASCFGPWRDEFALTLKRSPNFKVLAGGELISRKSAYFKEVGSGPELYLITYQTFLNDHQEVASFMRRRGIEIFLVVDEAHYIKKVEGNWAKSVLDLSSHALFRCVLTGTPMPRSYTDIFNLFDFLWPGHNPIDQSTKIKIRQLEEEKRAGEIKNIIKEKAGPLFYRVRKSELGLRPPIFHEPVLLKMNHAEGMLYDAIMNRIKEYSQEDYLKNAELIKKLQRGRIIRLRQCVSYAKLLLTAVEDYKEELLESHLRDLIVNYDKTEIPAKLEYLLRFVKDAQKKKEKIVIWSNFVGTLELIQRTLSGNGIYSKIIYGKTPIEQTSLSEEESREKIRKEFVNPKSGLDVLVANPAACAESISLHTTCHKALYYDLSYNLAQYLQSLDRIHRVGGSETVEVHYYFLQYIDTIDQDIGGNLAEKSQKMFDLIEEDYAIYDLDMTGNTEDTEAFKRVFKK